jgi:hypothetical protein
VSAVIKGRSVLEFVVPEVTDLERLLVTSRRAHLQFRPASDTTDALSLAIVSAHRPILLPIPHDPATLRPQPTARPAPWDGSHGTGPILVGYRENDVALRGEGATDVRVGEMRARQAV